MVVEHLQARGLPIGEISMMEEQLFELDDRILTTNNDKSKICFKGDLNCVCYGFILGGFDDNINPIIDGYTIQGYPDISIIISVGKTRYSFTEKNIIAKTRVPKNILNANINGKYYFEKPVLLSDKELQMEFCIKDTNKALKSTVLIMGYGIPRYNKHTIGDIKIKCETINTTLKGKE